MVHELIYSAYVFLVNTHMVYYFSSATLYAYEDVRLLHEREGIENEKINALMYHIKAKSMLGVF